MLFKNISVLDENYEVKKDYYIVTEGNKITYMGDKMPEGQFDEVYDGKNKLAAPGFFNIHCHVPMVLLRGYGEGLPLDRWLFDKMFPFEALLTGEDVYWGSLLGIAEMMASGAVSITDMYFEMSDICRAIDDSGFKANLSHGTSAGGAADSKFSETGGFLGMESLFKYTKGLSHDRIIAEASIHAEYTSGPILVEEVIGFAKEKQLGIHLHLSETESEHLGSIKRRRMTPAQWFDSKGVFDVPVTAAHCVWVSEEDMDILAEKNVTIAHCPSSNLKLGSGIAPLKTFYKKGINIGIGTDGAASNNNLNVLEEVNLAAILHKGANKDPLFLSTSEMFKMASFNGAKSQRRHDCGCLKVGNRADIVVYDMDKPHLIPTFDYKSNILYAADKNDVQMNMIDGQVVYKDGEYKTMDIERVKYESSRIAQEKYDQLNK